MPKERYDCSLREMRERELWWVAGVLEGEGCFTTSIIRGKRWLKIQMRNTDHSFCLAIQGMTGIGRVWGPITAHDPKHSPQYLWVVDRQNDCEALMTLLRPLMSEKRQGQIDKAFSEVA